MLASQAKTKGKGKATLSCLKAATSAGHDLSGLSFAMTVLGSTLHSVPLKTNIRVFLEPMGSPRRGSHNSLRPIDEKAEGGRDDERRHLGPE